MRTDIAKKRGKFIGKVNSLMQELHFADSETMTKLINVYTTSFYGSSLWDLQSADCERIYKSWNVKMRNILNLDRYVIEPMSGCLNPKVMLMSRLTSFHKSLVKSPKFSLRFLARLVERDMRTGMGRTLEYLLQQRNLTSLDDLCALVVKKHLEYAVVPEAEAWRVPLALELKDVKDGKSNLGEFSHKEIEEMLVFACSL